MEAYCAIDDVVGNAVERQWCSKILVAAFCFALLSGQAWGQHLDTGDSATRDGYQRGVWSERSISPTNEDPTNAIDGTARPSISISVERNPDLL